MGKKKGFFLPVFAALAALTVGHAVFIFLPLPEERATWAYDELERIKIKSVRWRKMAPSKAVEEVNQEIQKMNRTRYRLIFAEGANDVERIDIELDNFPVTDLARYISALSGNEYYRSPNGIVIDRKESADAYRHYDSVYTYDNPSWLKEVRNWLRYRPPWMFLRWFEPPPPPDPFAPTPGK